MTACRRPRCATLIRVRRLIGHWELWAGVYIALVGATATLNQLVSGEHWGWYAASLALTLPLSPFAIYPILFLTGVVSDLTGGDPINENAFGSAAVVGSFIALAAVNVAVARTIAAFRGSRPQTAGSTT